MGGVPLSHRQLHEPDDLASIDRDDNRMIRISLAGRPRDLDRHDDHDGGRRAVYLGRDLEGVLGQVDFGLFT